MAGYVLAAQNVGSWQTGSDPVVTLPAGWAPGQLGLLFGSARSSAETVLDPSGWTRLAESSTLNAGLWGRIMQSGDTAPTLDFSAASHHRAQIVTFSGDVYGDINTIVAHSNVQATAGSSTWPHPGINVSTAGCLIVGCAAKQRVTPGDDGIGIETASDPAGFTRIDTHDSTGGNLYMLWLYQQQVAAANVAAGNYCPSWTSAGNSVYNFFVALRSSSAAPTPLMGQAVY